MKTEKEIACGCVEWQESAHQIFMAQIENTLMTGKKYTGGVFKYCPFCGKKLVLRNIATAMNTEGKK